MPVIIALNHVGWWMKDDDPRSEMHKLAMDATPDEPLKIYSISDLVNSPKTDDARCIEPVRIDRDFSSGDGGGMRGKAEIESAGCRDNTKIRRKNFRLDRRCPGRVIIWRHERSPLFHAPGRLSAAPNTGRQSVPPVHRFLSQMRQLQIAGGRRI